MKTVLRWFIFMALTPSLLNAASLWPAEHSTCVNALELSAFADCNEDADFYFDHNGRCGCLNRQDIVAQEKCTLQCQQSALETLSHLFQYQNHDGFYEIDYQGCACVSNDENGPSTAHTITKKEAKPSITDNFVNVACSTTDLTDAIVAANLISSTTLALASNCTYLYTETYTLTELFPPIETNLTIIGGEKTIIQRHDTANLVRIFTVNDGASLTLKKVRLDNAYTSGLGGGIFNSGTLSLEKVALTRNYSSNGGGICSIYGAATDILESEFIFNHSTSVGGGAFINFGFTEVSKSFFYGNTAPINGAGINVQPLGVTTISESSFSHNTSGSLGGALSNLGMLNIDHSAITENTASGGGGIATGNSNVFLDVVDIENNSPDNCSPLNTIDGCVN